MMSVLVAPWPVDTVSLDVTINGSQHQTFSIDVHGAQLDFLRHEATTRYE